MSAGYPGIRTLRPSATSSLGGTVPVAGCTVASSRRQGSCLGRRHDCIWEATYGGALLWGLAANTGQAISAQHGRLLTWLVNLHPELFARRLPAQLRVFCAAQRKTRDHR